LFIIKAFCYCCCNFLFIVATEFCLLLVQCFGYCHCSTLTL
jgi:hypothetical protein